MEQRWRSVGIDKTIGVGVMLAGEMRSMSEGKDLEHLFVEMSKPQGEIAKILRSYSTAMTDITGFGLLDIYIIFVGSQN